MDPEDKNQSQPPQPTQSPTPSETTVQSQAQATQTPEPSLQEKLAMDPAHQAEIAKVEKQNRKLIIIFALVILFLIVSGVGAYYIGTQ